MADRPEVKTCRITRDKLAAFLPTHELIKAFEDITTDVSETLPDAIAGTTTDTGSALALQSFIRPVVPQSFDEAAPILQNQIFGA